LRFIETVELYKTVGNGLHTPKCRDRKHGANTAPIVDRRMSDEAAKARTECSEALVAETEADVGNRLVLENQSPLGVAHTTPGEKIERSLMESLREEAMKVKWGEAGNPGRFAQSEAFGVVSRQKIASATKADVGVMVEHRFSFVLSEEECTSQGA
jgi:hypothetical protein